jgi:hypothetical protein
MRALTLATIVAMIAGSATSALAAEGKQGTIEKSKRESGDKSGGGGARETAGGEESILREDRRLQAETKPWEVEAAIEGHRLFRQNDLQGAAADKNLLYYGFLGRYQITQFDQVQAAVGFYERFLADPGETGLRADDATLGYWRLIPLPEDFELRLNARFTIPFSFASQKASAITSPSIGVRVTRVFFNDLVVNFRTRGTYNIVHYATAEGGQPNSKGSWSVNLDAEYQMPFYHPVSAGAELYTGYVWYYKVQTTGPGIGDNSATFDGAVQDPVFGNSSQTTQQRYGGDIFVRYTFPEWNGLKTDVEVALANGDPAIGYDNRLHDGVAHTYFAFRRSAEMFAVFTAVY